MYTYVYGIYSIKEETEKTFFGEDLLGFPNLEVPDNLAAVNEELQGACETGEVNR